MTQEQVPIDMTRQTIHTVTVPHCNTGTGTEQAQGHMHFRF